MEQISRCAMFARDLPAVSDVSVRNSIPYQGTCPPTKRGNIAPGSWKWEAHRHANQVGAQARSSLSKERLLEICRLLSLEAERQGGKGKDQSHGLASPVGGPALGSPSNPIYLCCEPQCNAEAVLLLTIAHRHIKQLEQVLTFLYLWTPRA